MSRHPSQPGPGPGWRPDTGPVERPTQTPARTGTPEAQQDPQSPQDPDRHGTCTDPGRHAPVDDEALSRGPAAGARPDPRRRGVAEPRRRRDRHGHGLRGPLLPRHVPAWRSRSARFDDRVLDSVERLERRWSSELDGVEVAVEDVPPSDPAPWEDDEVPLGRLFPAQGELPPRIVVYRRPVETRAADDEDLGPLVHDVVVEQVAHLLRIPPERVDPRYRSDT